jgi:DNA-directed RNA polymerase
MRKSLECLLEDNESGIIDKVSESLDYNELPEVSQNAPQIARQRALEQGAYMAAIKAWKHEMDEALRGGRIYPNRLGIQSLAWDWVQAMKPVLQAHIENIRPKYLNQKGQQMVPNLEKDTHPARLDHIWLTGLPVETLCAITVMEIVRGHARDTQSMGSKAVVLLNKIGRTVESEMKGSDLIKKENRGLHPKEVNLRQLFTDKTRASRYAVHFHRNIINGVTRGVSVWPFEWNLDVRARVHLFRKIF